MSTGDATRITIGMGADLADRLDRLVGHRLHGWPEDAGAMPEIRRRERQAAAFACLAAGIALAEEAAGIGRQQEPLRDAGRRKTASGTRP